MICATPACAVYVTLSPPVSVVIVTEPDEFEPNAVTSTAFVISNCTVLSVVIPAAISACAYIILLVPELITTGALERSNVAGPSNARAETVEPICTPPILSIMLLMSAFAAEPICVSIILVTLIPSFSASNIHDAISWSVVPEIGRLSAGIARRVTSRVPTETPAIVMPFPFTGNVPLTDEAPTTSAAAPIPKRGALPTVGVGLAAMLAVIVRTFVVPEGTTQLRPENTAL